MSELEFWSKDGRFGLKVMPAEVKKILRLCRRSHPHETGGILLGRYSEDHNCALVTAATSAPVDSRSGRTWFVRGVRGLQKTIDRLWTRQHEYYLGEWHFHPGGAPDPSQTDIEQVQEIAYSEQYHCPEPVLLIIGGEPSGKWSARSFVFPRHRAYTELLEKIAAPLKGKAVISKGKVTSD